MMLSRWWHNFRSSENLIVQLRTNWHYKTVAFIVILLLVIALAVCFKILPPSYNILSAQNISASYGVIREQRMFNRKVPDMNYPVDDFVSSIFLAEDSFVTFDLGKLTEIQYLQLNSHQNNFLIWSSLDGLTFTPIATNISAVAGSVVNYYSEEKKLPARYIKLTITPGTKTGAAYEFLVLREQPANFPLTFETQSPPTYQSALDADLHRLKTVRSIKMFACVVIILLLYILQSKAYNVSGYIYAIIFTFGILSFLLFQNPIGNLHQSEIAHYYIGAKYYKEIGYKDFYRELARNEIKNGRGIMIERTQIRDLEKYELFSGSRVYGELLSAHSNLSPSGSAQLSKDVDNIRTLFGYAHYQNILTDHGYNGSPLYTAIFGFLFKMFPASYSFFTVMALLDILLLIGGLTLIWLAFGPLAGTVSSLIIGLGEPWSYLWTGGSVGRYLWFFLFCLGFALLRKNNRLLSMSILCVAGLLRIFPFVFVLGISLNFIFNVLKNKTTDVNYRWIYGAVLVLAIGFAIPIFAYNFDIYPQFLEKMRLHAQNQSLNRITLSYIFNNKLITLHDNFNVVTLVKIAFVTIYLFMLHLLSKNNLSEWHSLPISGILIFAIFPLSSYDYIWTVCLVPIIISSKVRTMAFFLTLCVSNYMSDSFIKNGHLYTNIMFGAFIVLFYISYITDLLRQPEKLEYV